MKTIKMNIGDIKMKTNAIKFGSAIIFTNDPTYLPVPVDILRGITLQNLPVGVEIIPYDSIANNNFTLDGFRISLKKDYLTKVVIGSVDSPEFIVTEHDEIDNKSCLELIDDYKSLLSQNVEVYTHIAA